MFPQTHKPYFSRNYSNPSSTASKEDSFKVSYLVNRCGFSLESASSASKYLHFDGPEKPDSVINFFSAHGFSQTETSKVVKRNPNILLYRSDRKVITSLKYGSNLFNKNFDSHMAIIIKFLRGEGFTDSNIAWILMYHSHAVASLDRIEKNVEELKKMGFSPLNVKFVVGLKALDAHSKSSWRKKLEVYKRWGWTEEEVLGMFKRYPWCMTCSEEKISGVMDIFVNKLGWDLSVIARYPNAFSFSLERRIVPRDSVIQFLLSKELIKKNSYSPRVFIMRAS
ncbi:hypothetical protein Tsubulata_034632 [Turnera subulata]|uniref:Uncharacterized protein n=1 Tax=Turnera subulata TaxID=218843 RepID=A0A9Q0J0F7_9ROSI|nr:hypothetical protein Tsubulata_034632 [Turnera subulata]